MRLVYPEIERNFEFGNGNFHGLVIENPSLMYRFVEDIFQQCNGGDGESILSDRDEPISFSGNLDLLSDFFPFEINRKGLLAKIASEMEKQALSPEFFERSQRLLSDAEKWIDDLAFDAGFELDLPKLSIAALLKSAGPRLKEEYVSLAEKIFDYIDFASRFGLAKIFVLVNLRSFLDDMAMEKFVVTCCQHNYDILLIDHYAGACLPGEVRTVIDADLCEL